MAERLPSLQAWRGTLAEYERLVDALEANGQLLDFATRAVPWLASLAGSRAEPTNDGQRASIDSLRKVVAAGRAAIAKARAATSSPTEIEQRRGARALGGSSASTPEHTPQQELASAAAAAPVRADAYPIQGDEERLERLAAVRAGGKPSWDDMQLALEQARSELGVDGPSVLLAERSLELLGGPKR